MIHHETLLDGLLVIIGATTLLTTQDQTAHQLVLGHIELDHRSHLVATLVEHLLQGLCLWNRAGEAVEDHTLVLTTETVVNAGQNADHQVVGDQLTVINILLGCLTQFGTLTDLITEHIARRDMVKTILLNQLVALRALTGTRSTENHNILHYPVVLWLFTDNRIYIFQPATLLIVVEPIADDEIIGDAESHIIEREILFQLLRLEEQRAYLDRGRITSAKRLDHLPHRLTTLHDILYNHDRATTEVLIDTDDLLDLAGRRGALIGSQLHERHLAGDRHLAHQIGSKDKRAVEHCQEQRILSFQILAHLLSQKSHTFLNLRLGNGHFERLVLNFNNAHTLKEIKIFCKITKNLPNSAIR